MTRYLIIFLILITTILSLTADAQIRVEYESIGKSKLIDYWGNKYGSGDMNKLSLSYLGPLSRHWMLSTYADYINMNNTGQASDINYNRILNLGISCGFHHSLSVKWSIMATVGAGVFAPVDEVSLKSILGNCGTIFICHLNGNLDIGGGLGISNAYGVPMVMPMLYLNWHRNGKFNFNIDMSSGINVGASVKLGTKFRIDLTAINISGISAVRERESKSKIYSQLCVYSSLSPSWSISESTSLFIGIGGSWARSVSESERSLKAFFNSFSEEHRSKDFGVALRLNAGIKWKF